MAEDAGEQLLEAAEKGQIDKIRKLLGAGADVNGKDFYGPGQGNKKCKFFGRESGLSMVNLGPFRAMSGAPRPLKVGRLRPPTFPGTSAIGFAEYVFSIFDFKKFEEI